MDATLGISLRIIVCLLNAGCLYLIYDKKLEFSPKMSQYAHTLLGLSTLWSLCEIIQYAMETMEPIRHTFSMAADYLGIIIMYIQFVFQLQILQAFSDIHPLLSKRVFRIIFGIETVLLILVLIAQCIVVIELENIQVWLSPVFLVQTISLVIYEFFHNYIVLKSFAPLKGLLTDGRPLELMKYDTVVLLLIDVLSWLCYGLYIVFKSIDNPINALYIISVTLLSVHIIVLLIFNHHMRSLTRNTSNKSTESETSKSKNSKRIHERTTVKLGMSNE